MSLFGGDSYPHDLCLPRSHLADAQVDGASMRGGYAVYISRAARLPLPAQPVVPPALRGTRKSGPEPPAAPGGELVWVVLALDPQQEKVLLQGGGGVVNRAVVHLLYEDGTVISHFDDLQDAQLVAAALCEVTPGRHPGPEPEI